jgi:aspartate racemase
MEQAFYRSRLTEKYGIEVIVPDEPDREVVHRVIYDELCLGKVVDSSRQQYLKIIQEVHQQGAEAVILGCTEIAMLVKPEHTDCLLYDTTEIHAKAAVERALKVD